MEKRTFNNSTPLIRSKIDRAAMGVRATRGWFDWARALGRVPGWRAMSTDLNDLAGGPVRAGLVLADAADAGLAPHERGAWAAETLASELNRRVERERQGQIQRERWRATEPPKTDFRNPVPVTALRSPEAVGSRAGWACADWDSEMDGDSVHKKTAEALAALAQGDNVRVGLALADAADAGLVGRAASTRAAQILRSGVTS